jgi:hypothetical protein
VKGAKYGASFGLALAIAISYTTSHAILWGIAKRPRGFGVLGTGKSIDEIYQASNPAPAHRVKSVGDDGERERRHCRPDCNCSKFIGSAEGSAGKPGGRCHRLVVRGHSDGIPGTQAAQLRLFRPRSERPQRGWLAALRKAEMRRKLPFPPCRWAGRISVRPWFDAVWPKTVGQASKALFMVGPGTQFDARPRVWPGLLSPVTSTDEP